MKRAALALLVVAGTILAAEPTAPGQRWWSYVEFLAGDKLEGRLTGSEGHRRAAEFIADRFKRDGLQPAGIEGYFQPVRFVSRTIVEKQSTLALVRAGRTEPLEIGEDAIISARIEPAPTVDAPLVFAGYGFAVPEKLYDPFAGQDLRGKVVVYIYGGPSNIPGPLRSHYQSTEERWKALKKAGAVGAVTVFNPHHTDIPWSRQKLLRFQPSMTLADPALEETPGEKISLFFNPAHADKLFEGSGHTFDELIALADSGKPLPSFPLPLSLRARVAFDKKEVTSDNVAGTLSGSDPKLKNEYIILSAHLDHLGVGEPIHGDRIYNGAMDNAAGVGTVLDAAGALHESGTSLRRSVLFLAVTGEEKGLLGSKYFAAHPTISRNQLVGDLNVDMFLPIYPLRLLTVYGLDESDLGPMVKSVAASVGVKVQPDPTPERNIFIRSDQYSFIKVGIPSVFFGFGYAKGSSEETLVKQWLTERYHAPSDDIHQRVDLAAAAKYNRIVRELAEKMANRDDPPQWNANSFFRRYAE